MKSLADNNVPIETLFFGRGEELDVLSRYTDDSGSVTVVTGIAGIGKTALLRIFESRSASNFSGGVFHVTGSIGSERLLRELEPIGLSTGPALVVIDDVETLQATELDRVSRFLSSKADVSLILSGRLVPIDGMPRSNVLTLKGQPFKGAKPEVIVVP